VDLPTFNAAPAAELTPALLACCDVPTWAAAVRASRPYPDVDALLATADAAARRFTPADVDRALDAHPRIGERAHRDGAEAGWSRQEQSGVHRDAETQQALTEGNRAYEQRFGRVFLIRAAGRDRQQILDELHRRLQLDPAREMATVASELRDIALFRIPKLFDRPTPQPEPDPTT
jgi:2-oxo-4-hydroxy-4-carboxy-5-ureidoimidazoline decarboxylase